MWKKVKLKDVCKIVNGGTPKSNVKEYWEGEIQWLTPKDMGKLNSKYVDATERQITVEGLDNSSAKLVPENSLILSCRAPIGHVFINSIEMSFNQGCKALIPSAELDINYLYYFVYSSKQLLNDLGTGTTFKEISSKTLGNVEISLPPLAEQRRIVAKLDAAFAEIDRAIDITDLQLLEVEMLKESALTQIISSSSIKKQRLSQLCEIQPPKKQVKSKLADEDLVTFMPMDKLNIGKIYSESSETKELKAVYSGYTYFENDDVLLAKITPCFENGKLSIARNMMNNIGFGSSEYIVLRCNEELLPEYLYYCLSLKNFRKDGEAVMSGAVGHKRVPKDFIENSEIPTPSLEKQTEIIETLNRIFLEINNYQNIRTKRKLNYIALKASILSQELSPSEAA